MHFKNKSLIIYILFNFDFAKIVIDSCISIKQNEENLIQIKEDKT